MTVQIERPQIVIGDVVCPSCRNGHAVDHYRPFDNDRRMDFCHACELQWGTAVLYRRLTAYGTPDITTAVFAAERTPVRARTADQIRLLVERNAAAEAPRSKEEMAQREIERRELMRRRLIYYVTQFQPEYKPGWVHQDICRKLEQFVRDVEDEKSPRLMIFVPPRHGKQLDHNTPVPTPDGMRKHGDLRPGDFVYHPSGRAIKVLAVGEESPQDCEVEFFDGSRVQCHENHEWTVFDRSARTYRTVETRYLETQVLTSGPAHKPRARFQLPLYDAVEGSPKQLPVDPYYLGAWLGDGRSSNADICGAKEDLEHITALIPYKAGARWVHKTTGVHYQGFVEGARTALRKAGLLDNKHIPRAYLVASVEQRRRLLEGLVDTDGSVDAVTHRVRFRSGSQRLVEDVAALVRSLGYRASVDYTPTDTRERHIVGGESWCVQWTPHDGQGGGTLPRKRVTRIRDRRAIGVKCVRRVEPSMGRCIQVDSPDGLYLVGETYVATHNSELASKNLPSWVLGKHPEWPIISTSYAQSLPLGFSRWTRDRLDSKEYKAIFPGTEIRPDARGVEEWITTKGGGFVAAGIGTGITGKGFKIGIVDDPIKDQEEASSDVIRNSAFEWYQAVFRTRAAPGAGILFINTRWHHDDPAGRLLNIEDELRKSGVPDHELERWEVVSYPAIAENDEYLISSGDIVESATPPDDAVRLLRKKGEALHPERYPIGELRKIRNSFTTSMWNALFQQRPTPDEGDFFHKRDFLHRQIQPEYTPLMRVFITADYAITKKQRSDFTVLGTFALDWDDNLWLLEMRRGRWGTFDIVKNAAELISIYKPEVYAGEQGQIHAAVWPVLEKELESRRLFISTDNTLVPINDKEVRARPLQARMQRRKFIFGVPGADKPDVYDVVEREMLQFPNAKFDDCVDCCAWAARLAMNLTLPKQPFAHKPMEGWKTKLAREHFRGTENSFMAY